MAHMLDPAANQADVIGVALGAVRAADGARVEHLDIEGAGPAAVVRADGGGDA